MHFRTPRWALWIGGALVIAAAGGWVYRSTRAPATVDGGKALTVSEYCQRVLQLNPRTPASCEKTVDEERQRAPKRYACRAACVQRAKDIGEFGSCVLRCPVGI